MAIEKSFNWTNQKWRRNQQGFLGWRRSSERVSFIVIMLNREVRLHVPRKESLSNIDFIRSTNVDLEIAQENKCMTFWMSTRTEICQIRERVSQDSRYWTKLLWRISAIREGEEEADENSNDITFKSHMAWRIDKNWDSRSKNGKPLFQNDRSRSEAKFICIDTAWERRNSV